VDDSSELRRLTKQIDQIIEAEVAPIKKASEETRVNCAIAYSAADRSSTGSQGVHYLYARTAFFLKCNDHTSWGAYKKKSSFEASFCARSFGLGLAFVR
jgi:hypothetical protein